MTSSASSKITMTGTRTTTPIANTGSRPRRWTTTTRSFIAAADSIQTPSILAWPCIVLWLFCSFTLNIKICSAHDASHRSSALSQHHGERFNSPIDACVRWSHQSALVNGTLYLYGGQASTEPGQSDNTWNNHFLTLDLTKSWNIASPALAGRIQPSGPPPVALGYLWNSRDALYLYGGEFSWKPAVSPTPFSTWEYNIRQSTWTQHETPRTSRGNGAPLDAVPVQRAAEGAGVSVPSLGRGFYFGGHLDGYTTPGWSQSIWRVYLQSLLEYTFPGAQNSQVDALSAGQKASSQGVYRNVTQGGHQAQAGFTQRADGLLIHVPGFSGQGILLALAGGTNTTFTQMNIVDVYDIATSQWYKQSTSGPAPQIRVNPCAVMAAAPDGSSYNIHMFGGQSLLPYGAQTQYDDMWILSLPAFVWIKVDTTNQSVPYARSGHTCNVWNGQMIVVGGYVGEQLSCDAPGIYVFDLSKLQWKQGYSVPSSASNPVGASVASNPLNQQPLQIFNATAPGGIEGSYGYQVPQAVVAVIGGNSHGSATLISPMATPTGGPLATGSPNTYPSANSSANESGGASDAPGRGDTTANSQSSERGTNVAAIVVGVICSLLFCIVCYLAFCAYLYRRQVQRCKGSAEVTQRQQMLEQYGLGGRHTSYLGLLRNAAAAGSQGDLSSSYRMSGGSSQPELDSYRGSGAHAAVHGPANISGYHSLRRNSDSISMDDLLTHQEPSFVGVMLNPRRVLRVVNRD